ncbi:hypothetical protein LTR86_003885 [Recurvomyces mirabilis]|nr:hypothetical protein LTR86_003885 [Recurvomyces mirabilis]
MSLYTPLKPWQIRILRLHAGSPGDRLTADLLVADVLDNPGLVLHDAQEAIEYEAVSYCWGEPVFDPKITVNKCKHAITSNLHQGLQVLRSAHDERYLWIDALCIDQTDASDKSAQVQRMFNIFRKARRVVVWLWSIEHMVESSLAYRQASSDFHREAAQSFAVSGTWLQGGRDEGFDEDILKARLRSRVCHPWVRRAWVQQEIFAARQVMVQCGRDTFTFDAFKESATRLSQLISEGGAHAPADRADLVYCNILRSMESSGSVELIAVLEADRIRKKAGVFCIEPKRYSEGRSGTTSSDEDETSSLGSFVPPERVTALECVLAQASNLNASNHRDRIYALLSLSTCPTRALSMQQLSEATPRTVDAAIDIDYSRSTSLVFQDVTKYILDRDRSLQILLYHTGRSHSRQKLGLPSWTPDWRRFERHNHDPRFRQLDRLHKSELEWSFRSDAGCLILQGFQVGTIAMSSDDQPPLIELDDGSKAEPQTEYSVYTTAGDVVITCAGSGEWFVMLRPQEKGFLWLGMCVIRMVGSGAEVSVPVQLSELLPTLKARIARREGKDFHVC